METYDIRCLVKYDKFLRPRMAAGFMETWNPDLLHPTWMCFIQGRTESGHATDFEDWWEAAGGEDITISEASKQDPLLLPVECGKMHEEAVQVSTRCSACGDDNEKNDKACKALLVIPGEVSPGTHVCSTPRAEGRSYGTRKRVTCHPHLQQPPRAEPALDEDAIAGRPSTMNTMELVGDKYNTDQGSPGVTGELDTVSPVLPSPPNSRGCEETHACFQGDDLSVNSATEIPEQKWHSVTDALAFLGPRFMGQLAFASRLVRGLSLFSGSGHALLRVKDKWLKISGGAKFDFRFVADCPALYNGQQVVLSRRVVKPSHFLVDASTGTGMGGFLDGKYFVVSWLELMAMPQEVLYPFRDRASSQINYLELFSVFWALALWGEGLRGLTVVLITDNTPTKGMLEKWRCTPDFKKLLRKIFQQCVSFDVRLIVEWVPSKVNEFADALSRKAIKLFFELHWEWRAASIWRQDRDDWMLFAKVFSRLDKRFGPFSLDACCDAFGANK
ncbi:hypothetical protein CYMTET_56134 [Cymbomonas tetramitiformis]|uniref:RNase H type-1 domain-containing protein n=1 Tax=Cymbomonas tetramitiformis TaxID=36881 RepID=A0AAE0BBJ6_9CHLO|nr:hypothetical protein CYMTET_56134 [Cymbomonas tetramitiformis]